MFRNRNWLLLLPVLLLLLTACQNNAQQATLYSPQKVEQSGWKLTEVSEGELIRSTSGYTNCEVVYQIDESILCSEVTGLTLKELLVSNGDMVEENEPMAIFAAEPDERKRETLVNELQVAKLKQSAEREQVAYAVQTAREALAKCEPGSNQEKICQIQLQTAQLRQVSNAAVEAAQDALDAYDTTIAGISLLAPAAGKVEIQMRIGDTAERQQVFGRVYSADSIYLRAANVSDVAYHYGAQVDIYRAGKLFCTGTVLTSGDVMDRDYDTLIVKPDPEADATQLTENQVGGVSQVGVSLMGTRLDLKQVLRLPKEAVRIEGGQYYVYVYEDGELHRRPVQVGAEGKDPETGAACLQILDGLQVGAVVTVG